MWTWTLPVTSQIHNHKIIGNFAMNNEKFVTALRRTIVVEFPIKNFVLFLLFYSKMNNIRQ